MRALGAALLRAGDDIAAELAEGYTAAERAVAATAGAARQAILEELLTGDPADPAAVSRLLRRAALAGLEPGQPHDLLVLRPAGEPERPADLAQELERRLARDPVRRPFLAAARGPDLVALAASPWRDGRPFADTVADLTDAPWWGVVAGPVPLEGVAAAYVDAVDALRVVPAIAPDRDPGRGPGHRARARDGRGSGTRGSGRGALALAARRRAPGRGRARADPRGMA